MASKKFPKARRKLFYTTTQGKASEREREEKCFLYLKGKLGIQGIVNYLGYCLS